MYRKFKKEIKKVAPVPKPKKNPWKDDGCDKTKIDIELLNHLEFLDPKTLFKYSQNDPYVVQFECGTELGRRLKRLYDNS
jgi:hypothetical protein